MILLKLVRYAIAMICAFITAAYLASSSPVVQAAVQDQRAGKFVTIDQQAGRNNSIAYGFFEWTLAFGSRLIGRDPEPATAAGTSLDALQNRRSVFETGQTPTGAKTLIQKRLVSPVQPQRTQTASQ